MPRPGGGGGSRGRGSSRGHKGGRRIYTTAESIQAEADKLKKETEWRKQRGDIDSDEEEGKEKTGSQSESESESESSDDENKVEKHKGIQHLISVENPNRAKKTTKKASEVDTDSTAPMSRREREEIEKVEAKKRYDKLHAAGKTEEAQSDLARLAIIRKQREDANKKKEEEKKAAEAKAAGKNAK